MMRWNSTKTYTEDDMVKMQQEAVNRVHEFQTRTRDIPFYDMPTIGAVRPPLIEAESHVLPLPEPPPQPMHHQPPPPPPSIIDPIHGLLEKLDIDSETLLVLGLMFLLYNEKADNTLLVALAYLLL